MLDITSVFKFVYLYLRNVLLLCSYAKPMKEIANKT